ncbi:MAG: DEAD/DEAH box helicase family protein, partial [Candidatus Omnitrophica bacterium]|nr:DEAD/DEAH box helicase family protein [Candidatus Omnitrophota bacterium]
MDIKKFPEEVKFLKEWRPYQKRILSELEEHFDDNKLHVVAAPGSGKTVLGLEVIVRLNQPTLVLAPTLTIRNQWIDRFINLFLPVNSPMPDWITTDIKRPRFLTVSTYQALHCAYSGFIDEAEAESEEEIDENEEGRNHCKGVKGNKVSKVDVFALLRKAGIKVILVDEAHHLRNEWWQTLTAVKESIENVKTVALTATPPYDVSPFEWARYQDFCGPIDSEIFVPELVLEGNLCPHQDYVYFCSPSKEESIRIREFRSGVEQFYSALCVNQDFINGLRQHPWV